MLSARDVSDETGIPYHRVLEWAAQHGVPKVGPTFVFDEHAIEAIDADFADDDENEDELEENDSEDDEDEADAEDSDELQED